MPQARASIGLQARVLIADDDPIFRSIVVRQLTVLGATAVEADSGGAAWSMALESAYDLALVDLDMPGVNGADLIACLRGHPQTRHMPIVVITTHSDNAVLRDALAKGATACLTKPVNWSIFAGFIGHLLRLGSALRREAEQSAPATAAPAGVSGVAADVRDLVARCRRLAARPGIASDVASEAQMIAQSLTQLVQSLESRSVPTRVAAVSGELRRQRDVA